MSDGNGIPQEYVTVKSFLSLFEGKWLEEQIAKGRKPIDLIDQIKFGARGAEKIIEGKDEEFHEEIEKSKPGLVPKGEEELKAMAEAMKLQERIKFGIPGLSELVGGGMLPGWITVVGAFSGNGKTSFCIHEAVNLALRGHPVFFITAELSEAEVYYRALVALGPAKWPSTLKVGYPECDVMGITEAIQAWLEGIDSSELTPIVVVDYMQKLHAGGKQFSREREVATVAEQIQLIGRKFGICIILAAQLNRQSQEDTPKLHHLRESGLLEQIADLALLLKKTDHDRLDVSVAKNRWGVSEGHLDLTVDFASYSFGAISPQRKFLSFANEVVELLKEKHGTIKVRDVTHELSFDGKHPNKFTIIEAGNATGLYKVIDTEVVLI